MRSLDRYCIGIRRNRCCRLDFDRRCCRYRRQRQSGGPLETCCDGGCCIGYRLCLPCSRLRILRSRGFWSRGILRRHSLILRPRRSPQPPPDLRLIPPPLPIHLLPTRRCNCLLPFAIGLNKVPESRCFTPPSPSTNWRFTQFHTSHIDRFRASKKAHLIIAESCAWHFEGRSYC